MSTRLTDQKHLPKRKFSNLNQIQDAGGEEEIALVEALEVEVMETMDKEMLEEKSQDK